MSARGSDTQLICMRMQVVDALQGLQSLRHLSLQGNPLCTGTLLNDGPALIAMPDMRRAVYHNKLIYRLLRLESLDGVPIAPELKVRAANFAGVDVDAHAHCYNKYFPPGRAPVQDRELVIGRLHRPDPYAVGEMIFPDVWIHRQIERCVECQFHCVAISGSWMPPENAQEEMIAEEAFSLVLEGDAPCQMILVLGCNESCNAGTQNVSTLVAVQQRQSREWRVRRLFQGLDVDNSGAVDKDEILFCDRNGRFFDKLDADKDGKVTADELVHYFDAMCEQRGSDTVDKFVKYMETACEEQGHPIGSDAPVKTFFQSSSTKLMATAEGTLEPDAAGASYELVAQADLEGASVDASGEHFFCWAFGSREFSLGGLSSEPLSSMIDQFSSRLNKESVTLENLRIKEDQVKKGPLLNPAELVGLYGDQNGDCCGGIDLRTLELANDGVCWVTYENHPEDKPPSGKPGWIDGTWEVDGNLVRTRFSKDDAIVDISFKLSNQTLLRQECEFSDDANAMVPFFAANYMDSRKYFETFMTALPKYTR